MIQIINKRQYLTSLDAQKICTARKRKKNKVMNQMSDRIMSTFNRIIVLSCASLELKFLEVLTQTHQQGFTEAKCFDKWGQPSYKLGF